MGDMTDPSTDDDLAAALDIVNHGATKYPRALSIGAGSGSTTVKWFMSQRYIDTVPLADTEAISQLILTEQNAGIIVGNFVQPVGASGAAFLSIDIAYGRTSAVPAAIAESLNTYDPRTVVE